MGIQTIQAILHEEKTESVLFLTSEIYIIEVLRPQMVDCIHE